MKHIHYSYQNLLSSRLGQGKGISPELLSQVSDKGKIYTNTIQKEWKAGLHPFLDLPSAQEELETLKTFIQRKTGTFSDLVLLGVGGSSLGLNALHEALFSFQKNERQPKLHLIDNTDPSTLLKALTQVNPRSTLCVAISRSGKTLDTLAGLAWIEQWLTDAGCSLGQHLLVITGDQPKNFLQGYAQKHQLSCFLFSHKLSGRFSVLSSVGLLPAGLLGYDIAKLIQGAKDCRDNFLQSSTTENAPLLAALLQAELTLAGKKIAVFMPYTSRLQAFGNWYAQLLAESLGKPGERHFDGTLAYAPTPLTALGAKDQHSLLQLFLEGPEDKVITFLEIESFENHLEFSGDFDYEEAGLSFLRGKTFSQLLHAQRKATEKILQEKGRPSACIKISHLQEETLGALFMFFQLQILCMAKYFEVNPYNQPGVEQGKILCQHILENS